MKIALSWLKRYLELDKPLQLSDLLTFAGIEVEGIQELPAFGNNVFAARVISAEKVPKTDHLQLCSVDIGEIPYPEKDENNCIAVICGAPNCSAGMMAVLALPGADLGELKIEKAKIRGIHSHGMLCSERELGLSENHAGIIVLPSDTKVGTLADTLYDLPDCVFELEITPNRSDLLGYIGIARDLSAKLLRPMTRPILPKLEIGEPELNLGLKNLQPELCPRYTARIIKGVMVKESPLWLKAALLKSGLRPINNIVDITNYVMLESGHPLHAFDYDKLLPEDEAQTYPYIVVRTAFDKEEFLALDGKKYSLDGDELVIADGKKASALAGVMGSEYSAISEKTVNIVLECAAFQPGSIRRTSYKHKLSTDSSYRFERHLSAKNAAEISDRATALILELAGGMICGELLDSYLSPEEEIILGVRPHRFESLIGYTLPKDKIREILENLGFVFIQYGDFKPGPLAKVEDIPALQTKDGQDLEYSGLQEYNFTHYYQIPAFRKDVTREADILEELARLAGYDKVPQKTFLGQIMDRKAYKIQNQAMDWIVACGAYETLNYSFTDPVQMQDLGYKDEQISYIHLLNPQSSNQSAMRVSLLPQLLSNLAYNLNHAERDVKLFELGKVYLKNKANHHEPKHLAAIFTGKANAGHWQEKAAQIDYYWIKGCFEGLLSRLGIKYQAGACELPYLTARESFTYYHEETLLGSFGRIKPAVLQAWGIDANSLGQDVWTLDFELENIVTLSRNAAIIYQDIPKFPAVTRDLSFLISDQYSYLELQGSIMSLDQAIIREVRVFDEYRSKQIPQGFRSLSLHIVIQDQEKTLTDERVDKLMASVQKTLTEKFEITMR
ncbi:MAG: phenylalanine--tRNA ligase subunit beta [Candidatus Cloacimonetes bacterium]|jgi:phenylalanyl-tRNA synthetase beta chain|nr:phenylalanine--tRNA ligase subunit beta [Candidatus Cloacimonadota bacterium]MCK9584634.1 phenylalanine--tRNA ligase subunit beta [Candidatus Cloacimonadota bacterium]MDY0229352.1 phenylalanine--tRNA ligase subunit beta [Candidatus Cloacimonadaceae bacterium]